MAEPRTDEDYTRPIAADAWEDLGVPEKLQFLREPSRFKCAWGGRDACKSWTFARVLLWKGRKERLRILCAREFQNSIQESVHWLLCDQVKRLGYMEDYRLQQTAITGFNGSEFIFKGLKTNPHAIMSLEGVDIVWIEQAEKFSKRSWEVLIPTIRKAGSEIWVVFNPDLKEDPTSQMFIENPIPEAVIQEMNWRDNPYFTEDLRKYKDYLAAVDVDAYNHVYEGKYREHSEAQVLKGKWSIEWFAPEDHWNGPYHGADFGFAQDPTTLVRCWIDGRVLYVEELVYSIGLDIDLMAENFSLVGRHVVRCDSSRPETISFLNKNGVNAVAVAKGPGSVEDGIAFLRSFERIVIHPEAKHAQDEARLYCYKTDSLSGDVMAQIVDKHNHCWDAVRYAVEPVQKNFPFAGLDLS